MGNWINITQFIETMPFKLQEPIKEWFNKHQMCKLGPQGPEIVHKWDQTIKGYCPKCKETQDFTALLQDHTSAEASTAPPVV